MKSKECDLTIRALIATLLNLPPSQFQNCVKPDINDPNESQFRTAEDACAPAAQVYPYGGQALCRKKCVEKVRLARKVFAPRGVKNCIGVPSECTHLLYLKQKNNAFRSVCSFPNQGPRS
eukprot:278948-Prorocentrum_minimum.AAC.4